MTELFAGVIGHSEVVQLLESELDQPAQAYLFVGPTSVGKATVATRFASGLLGGRTDERTARLASELRHPDLVVVEPEGATSIGVDQAREVVARASMRPVESSRMVFLMPDAGSMTEQAANVLLKTLEEPAPHVVFLLVSESEDDFPPTVASRCRSVHMGRVPAEVMEEAFVDRGFGDDAARNVVRVSGGRPGLALALVDQPEAAKFRELWLSIPGRLTPHPGDGQLLATEVLAELSPLVDDAVSSEMTKDVAQRTKRRVEMSLLVSGLEILASWYSDSASLQMGGPIRNADVDLASLTEVSPRKAVSSADTVLDAVIDIQGNMRRELVLANLFSGLGSEE